jgi:hypothetical protein
MSLEDLISLVESGQDVTEAMGAKDKEAGKYLDACRKSFANDSKNDL